MLDISIYICLLFVFTEARGGIVTLNEKLIYTAAQHLCEYVPCVALHTLRAEPLQSVEHVIPADIEQPNIIESDIPRQSQHLAAT